MEKVQKKVSNQSHMARTLQALERDPNSTVEDLAESVHGNRNHKNAQKVYTSLTQWRKRGISIGPSEPGARVMCLGFDLADYTESEITKYHTSYIKRISSHKRSLRSHDSKVIEKHPHLFGLLLENAFKSFEDEKKYYEDITQKHKGLEGGPESA